MDNLQKNLNNYQFFYKNKKKKEIIETDELILKIKNNKIADYIPKYKTDLDTKIIIMENELKDKVLLLESRFFRNIYTHNKKKYKDDDDCYNKSIKDFHELKNIFDKGGLRASLKKSSKEKILSICLRGFKQENIQ